LNATNGTTLILVTHDNELTQQASRVIGVRAGRLVADAGTTLAAAVS